MNFRRFSTFILLLFISFTYSDCMSTKKADYEEVLKRTIELLDSGVDVNTPGRDGMTFLMGSVSSGNEPLFLELLERDADTTLKNNNEETVMSIAIRRKDARFIELLKLHADYLSASDDILGPKILEMVNKGDLGAIKILFVIGADVNTVDSHGNSLLINAVRKHNEFFVSYLLGRGANINLANNEGLTPLMFAVMDQDENIVRILLLNGADRNIVSASGLTAIELAKLDENIVIKKILINSQQKKQRRHRSSVACKVRLAQSSSDDSDEDINRVDSKGNSRLINAVEIGDESRVSELLKKGADINLVNNIGLSALMIAVKNNLEFLVSELLKKGADINLVNNRGMSALIFAIKNGNESIFLELLENGARPNIIFSTGIRGKEIERTSLQFADRLASFDENNIQRKMIKKYLQIYNSDPNFIGRDGLPLIIGEVKAGSLGGVRVFLLAGAYIDVLDKTGLTPLMYAIEENQTEIANFLIDKGADINLVNNRGMSALIFAIKNGNESIFLELLENGAKPNIVFSTGTRRKKTERTPLQLAEHLVSRDESNMERKRIKKYLQIWNSDPNSIGRDELPLIIGAVKYGSLGGVRVLLVAGAYIDVLDSRGFTPLMFAIEGNRTEIAKFLIKKGADLSKEALVNGVTVNALNLARQAGNNEIIDLINQKMASAVEEVEVAEVVEVAEDEPETLDKWKARQRQEAAQRKADRDKRRKERREERREEAENGGKKRHFWRRRKK